MTALLETQQLWAALQRMPAALQPGRRRRPSPPCPAGAAALPRAFVLLGLLLAGGFLLLMGYMTREQRPLGLQLG